MARPLCVYLGMFVLLWGLKIQLSQPPWSPLPAVYRQVFDGWWEVSELSLLQVALDCTGLREWMWRRQDSTELSPQGPVLTVSQQKDF